MKKTILLLFAFLICIQFSYCQKSDTVNLKNTMSETSRYINRSLVAAQVGGVLAATGAAMCFIGIKSYSTTFVSKSPLYFSGLCCVGSAVCIHPSNPIFEISPIKIYQRIVEVNYEVQRFYSH